MAGNVKDLGGGLSITRTDEEAQRSLVPLLKLVPSILGGLGFATSVFGAYSVLTGLASNFGLQIFFGLVLLVLFGGASVRQEASQIEVGVTRWKIDRLYLGCCTMTLLFMLIAVVAFLGKKPANVSPVMSHAIDSRWLETHLIPETRKLIENAEGNSIDRDTVFTMPAPYFGPFVQLAESSDPAIPEGATSDVVLGITASNKNVFRFEISKTPQPTEVFIDEVTVTVHYFQPLPAFATLGAGDEAGVEPIQLLFFELSNQRKPMPWKFKPKWHLKSQFPVDLGRWGEDDVPVLRDSYADLFAGVLVSKVPGIYWYSATVTVHEPFAQSRTFDLVPASKPKVAIFTVVRDNKDFKADEIERMKLSYRVEIEEVDVSASHPRYTAPEAVVPPIGVHGDDAVLGGE